MRNDILIDIDTANIIERPTFQQTYPLINTGLESGMSVNKMYFDTYIPKSNVKSIQFDMPYIPSEKTAMIRIHSNDGLLVNEFDGGYWFDIFFNNKPLPVCEFGLVSKTFRFFGNINQESGVIDLYDMVEVDFSIGSTLYQDAYLIMKLDKTDYLKEPLIGVGLIRHINSSGNKSEIMRSVVSELEADNIKTKTIDITDDGSVMIDIEEGGND